MVCTELTRDCSVTVVGLGGSPSPKGAAASLSICICTFVSIDRSSVSSSRASPPLVTQDFIRSESEAGIRLAPSHLATSLLSHSLLLWILPFSLLLQRSLLTREAEILQSLPHATISTTALSPQSQLCLRAHEIPLCTCRPLRNSKCRSIAHLPIHPIVRLVEQLAARDGLLVLFCVLRTW